MKQELTIKHNPKWDKVDYKNFRDLPKVVQQAVKERTNFRYQFAYAVQQFVDYDNNQPIWEYVVYVESKRTNKLYNTRYHYTQGYIIWEI